MERKSKSEEIPKWAFQALLAVGGTIWGILVVVLGYIGVSFDARLVRIENILLDRSSSVVNNESGYFPHQENPYFADKGK